MVLIDDRDDDDVTRRPRPVTSAAPAWMLWLPIGLSSMLLVLFLVVLAQAREQSRLLLQLEQRVQGLENSRALDRTTVLEEQQRALVARLQSLEDGGRRLEALEQQVAQWRSALADLKGRVTRRSLLEPEASPPPSAVAPSRPATPARGADGAVLRPPPPASP